VILLSTYHVVLHAYIGIGTGEPRYYFRPLQEVKVDIPAPSGYWRQIGPTRYIYSAKRQPIGMVRTMEFYQGTASGTRTTWKMKEFEALPEATVGAIDARLKVI
jgi:hypothetical protein